MFLTICVTFVIAFIAGFLARGGWGQVSRYQSAKNLNDYLEAARAEGIESGKVIGWREATQYHDAANDSGTPFLLQTEVGEELIIEAVDDPSSIFRQVGIPWGGFDTPCPTEETRKGKLMHDVWHLKKCYNANEVNIPDFLKNRK